MCWNPKRKMIKACLRISFAQWLALILLVVVSGGLGDELISPVLNETHQVVVRMGASEISPVFGWTLLDSGRISISLCLIIEPNVNIGWLSYGVSSSNGLGSSLMYGGPKGGAAIIGRLDSVNPPVMEYSLLGPSVNEVIPWHSRGPTARDVKRCISQYCLEKAQTCFASPLCAETLRCGLAAVNISADRLLQNSTMLPDMVDALYSCTQGKVANPDNADEVAAAGALLQVAGCAVASCTEKIFEEMPVLNIKSSSILRNGSTVTMNSVLERKRISNIDFGDVQPVVFIVAFGALSGNGDFINPSAEQRTFLSLDLVTGTEMLLPLPAHFVVHIVLATIGLGVLIPLATCMTSLNTAVTTYFIPITFTFSLGLLAGIVSGVVVAADDPFEELDSVHSVLGFCTISIIGLIFLVKGIFLMSQRDSVARAGSKRFGRTHACCVPRYVRAALALMDICSMILIISTMFTGLEMSWESAVTLNNSILTGPVIASVFCGSAAIVQMFAWKANRQDIDETVAVESQTSSNRELVSSAIAVDTSPDIARNGASGLAIIETIIPFILAWEKVTIYPERFIRPRTQAEPRPIVQSAIGICSPRTFTAILGPSGSGKSSLLEVIALRAPIPAGANVTINGTAAHMFPMVHRLMTFVPQEDHLHEHLTVRETLEFMCELVFPYRMTERVRRLRLEQIIAQLNLEDVLNTRVGGNSVRGISGGERKRLSIALQLFKPVSCLILDEPTTGLDSQMALRLIRLLRLLANEGRAIVATIHQPSEACFHLFDRIILLSGGYTLLSGPKTDMLQFLRDIGRPVPDEWNPAEWLLQIADVDLSATDSTSTQTMVLADAVHLEVGDLKLDTDIKTFSSCIRLYYEEVNPQKLIDEPDTVENLVMFAQKEGLSALDDQLVSKYATSIIRFLRTLPQECSVNDAPQNHVAQWSDVLHLLNRFAGSQYSKELVERIQHAKEEANARLALLNDRSKAEFFLYTISSMQDDTISTTSTDRKDSTFGSDDWEIKSRNVQLRVLVVRSLKLVWRNPQAFRIQVLQTVVLGILLGALYSNVKCLETGQFQQTVVMAMIVAMVALVTVSSGTQVAFDDRLVFEREMRDAIYSPLVFFLQRMLTSIPIAFTISLGIIIPAYFWVGLRPDRAAFAFFVLANALTVFTFDAAVFVIALVANDIHTAYAVANFYEAITMFFSGVSIPAYAMPAYLQWVHYLAPFSYSFGAVVVNQFEDTEDDFYINITGIVVQNKWGNLAILFGFGVAFRLMGLLATIRLFSRNKPGAAFGVRHRLPF